MDNTEKPKFIPKELGNIELPVTLGKVATYVLNDNKEFKMRAAIRINRANAEEWNKKGYGVFQTVNTFFPDRKIKNLKSINAWFVEIDDGEKKDQLEKIKKGLLPTMVVETQKGHHVYWKAKDATQERWRDILDNRLIPFYNGDKRAKDLSRILRVPGFYHMKDPTNPFLIKKIYEYKVEYSEKEMLHFYKDIITPKKQAKLHRSMKKQNPIDGPFWDRIWNLNCEYALSKLSGNELVNKDEFDFVPNSNGTKQIYCNNKSTSCWIDADGRIGSYDEGGPTVVGWISWYGHPMPKIIEAVKTIFPETIEDIRTKDEQLGLGL